MTATATMRVTLVQIVQGCDLEPDTERQSWTTKHNIKMFKVIKKEDSHFKQPMARPSTTHPEPRARRKKAGGVIISKKSKSEERVGRNGK